MIRLDKYLADMGVGTRTEVKRAISKGRVSVDGACVKKPETKIDTEETTVVFDGQTVGYTKKEYYMLHKPAGVYDFMKEMGYTQEYGYAYNTKVLLYSGTAPFDSFLTAFYSLAAIIIALIVFGSVSLIYNAFSISVSERTRQFGLLSSVGATRKQLRRMVLFEALAVSIVGIPLGILVGIGGIGITLLLIGDKFISIVRVDIPMRLCVSWQAVVIAAVIALVTVLISAWIPYKKGNQSFRRGGDPPEHGHQGKRQTRPNLKARLQAVRTPRRPCRQAL